MKTKFSELLKVKKQKVSEIESQLASKRFEKKLLLDDLHQIMTEIKALKFPKNGDFSQLKLAQYERTYFFHQKENKENMIKYFDQEIENLNYLYKKANIDYEKIKYLHELEEKKRVEANEKHESKAMDEIANQLFLLRQKKESI